MFWSRKTKLKDYEKVMKEFNFHIKSTEITEQYNNINEAYTKIKKYYEEKNKNQGFDIKIEKIRIERNLGIHSNNIISMGMAFYIAIMGSVFYFMIQQALNSLNIFSNELANFGITFAFLLAVICLISYNINKDIMKDKPRNLMLNISLKVLDDIEKEITEEQVRIKEEAEKLEIQQRVEQYSNAQNEVAATSDRIIDNTENDKKKKGNGKCINGFINIIINKIYSR